jgi:hypothetical protein
MVESENDAFNYCVILPERINENGRVQSKAFGVEADDDMTRIYDHIFGITSNAYKVLSICIYEISYIFTFLTNFSHFSAMTSAKSH